MLYNKLKSYLEIHSEITAWEQKVLCIHIKCCGVPAQRGINTHLTAVLKATSGRELSTCHSSLCDFRTILAHSLLFTSLRNPLCMLRSAGLIKAFVFIHYSHMTSALTPTESAEVTNMFIRSQGHCSTPCLGQPSGAGMTNLFGCIAELFLETRLQLSP